jgi:hypothetical protein
MEPQGEPQAEICGFYFVNTSHSLNPYHADLSPKFLLWLFLLDQATSRVKWSCKFRETRDPQGSGFFYVNLHHIKEYPRAESQTCHQSPSYP